MLIESLQYLFNRDLDLLKKEIEQYPDTESLWKVVGNITNSAANLSMHLCGNLQHFIGSVLGNTGYIRNREMEFLPNQGIAKEVLLTDIEKTKTIVLSTLSNLDSTTLENDYSQQVLGKTFKTGAFLMHLAGHLNYHLGQINYHRRILAG